MSRQDFEKRARATAPARVPLEIRLERIERGLEALLAGAKDVTGARVACEKFNAGVPMTANEVAVVLGYRGQTPSCCVHMLAASGLLKRRYHVKAGWHPDDIKAYMATANHMRGTRTREALSA